MMEVLAFLGRIFSSIISLETLVQQVLAFMGLLPTTVDLDQTKALVTETRDDVLDVQAGILIILDPTTGFLAQLAADVASLTLQIEGLTDGTTPVSLPVTPPAGYGGSSGSDVADAVWTWDDHGINPRQTGVWLNWAGTLALRKWVESIDYPYGNYFIPLSWPLEDPGTFGANYPTFNPSDILAGETMLDNLTRQNPGALTVSQYYPGGQVYIAMPITASLNQWVTTFDEIDFAAYSGLVSTVGQFALPVWPGLTNVVLGTTVALDRAVEIAEPMDGVLISLVTVPPDKPHYILGTQTATAHIGQIAFGASLDLMEYPQNLSFPFQVYCPLTIAHPSVVEIRTVPGVTGTAQAWTIAP